MWTSRRTAVVHTKSCLTISLALGKNFSGNSYSSFIIFWNIRYSLLRHREHEEKNKKQKSVSTRGSFIFWRNIWLVEKLKVEKYNNSHWMSTYPALNGGKPATSWYIIQPNAQRSELGKIKNKKKDNILETTLLSFKKETERHHWTKPSPLTCRFLC